MSVSAVDYTKTTQIYETAKAESTDSSDKSASSKESGATKYDTYETGKDTSFNRSEAQKAIKAAEDSKAKSMQTLINSMLNTQYSKYLKAMPSSNIGSYFANLQVDEATRLQAQQDISEDGYWGVKQTAGRILDFAKSIAGNDPEKLQEMKDAVEKGFEQARRMWGGELPSISGDTYDRVMQGFDEWEKSITSKDVAEQV